MPGQTSVCPWHGWCSSAVVLPVITEGPATETAWLSTTVINAVCCNPISVSLRIACTGKPLPAGRSSSLALDSPSPSPGKALLAFQEVVSLAVRKGEVLDAKGLRSRPFTSSYTNTSIILRQKKKMGNGEV